MGAQEFILELLVIEKMQMAALEAAATAFSASGTWRVHLISVATPMPIPQHRYEVGFATQFQWLLRRSLLSAVRDIMLIRMRVV